MKIAISIVTLPFLILASCLPAQPLPTPTNAPTPAMAFLPTATPRAVITETLPPTETIEEEEFIPNVESLTCPTKEDCADGKVEIGSGAPAFYQELITSIIEGHATLELKDETIVSNNDYLIEHFGVDANAPDADDKFLEALRERDYKMPAGFLLPVKKLSHSNSGGILEFHQMPPFKIDTVVIKLLTDETYANKRYATYPNKPELSNSSILTIPINFKGEGYVWGINIEEQSDGENRLVLMVATSTDLPWKEAGVDPNGSEAAKVWENLLGLFPMMLVNMKNAINDVDGKKAIGIEPMVQPEIFLEKGREKWWEGDFNRTALSGNDVIISSNK